MARENYSVKFGQQQLLVEYPKGSGIFTAPCGITGLTRTIDTNTQDVDLPPCDDPDAVIWLGIDPTSKRMTLTFEGTLADNAMPVWDDWSMALDDGSGTGDAAFREVRWYRNLGAPNQGYWEGGALLTQYQESSTGRARYTNSGTIIFDGQPNWVSIPPAPANTEKPTITGGDSAEVGTELTVDEGTWAGTPSYTYQWRADGINIDGETDSTYTPVADDEGKVLDCYVTGTNVSGSLTVLSEKTVPVEAGA